jgi:hypothetical protein
MRWSATIRDISQGGVRIHLKRRFEKGTGLAIELAGKDGRESTTVFVKVVHLGAQDDGTWILGCRFISDLSEDELQNAIASAAQDLPADSMTETVLATTIPASAMSVPAPNPVNPAPKFLTDVAFRITGAQGERIHCRIKRLNVKTWPLTAGSVIDLNGIPLAASGLRIKVTSCNQQGTGWLLEGVLLHGCGAK